MHPAHARVLLGLWLGTNVACVLLQGLGVYVARNRVRDEYAVAVFDEPHALNKIAMLGSNSTQCDVYVRAAVELDRNKFAIHTFDKQIKAWDTAWDLQRVTIVWSMCCFAMFIWMSKTKDEPNTTTESLLKREEAPQETVHETHQALLNV